MQCLDAAIPADNMVQARNLNVSLADDWKFKATRASENSTLGCLAQHVVKQYCVFDVRSWGEECADNGGGMTPNMASAFCVCLPVFVSLFDPFHLHWGVTTLLRLHLAPNLGYISASPHWSFLEHCNIFQRICFQCFPFLLVLFPNIFSSTYFSSSVVSSTHSMYRLGG